MARRTNTSVTPVAAPRRGGWTELRARLTATRLDRGLASGTPPGSDPLLCVRARQITTRAHGRALARDWTRVLERSQRPRVARSPATRLCRERILGAATEVRQLVIALSDVGLDSAQGVALAAELLTDGAGPLYNESAELNLRLALRVATSAVSHPRGLDASFRPDCAVRRPRSRPPGARRGD